MILFILYFIIALAFSAVYIILDLLEVGYIVDQYSTKAHQEQWVDLLTRSLYFSVITLFAVGYGDMVPIGLAKAVAILQAVVGYILPYAILLNYIVFKPKVLKKIHRKL